MSTKRIFYADTIQEVEFCGAKIYRVSGREYQLPFSVQKSETQHNLETCDNCKKHHEALIEEFQEMYLDFPNCCKSHSNLRGIREFKKVDFLDSPKWSANRIMFSYHHFLEWIDKKNWYAEITSYFEYCIESYGSFPTGCGEPFQFNNYFNGVLHLLKSNYIQNEIQSDTIPKRELKQRIDKIICYLNGYSETSLNRDKDINLLFAKYNEWYKLFPFDLEFFKPLKDKFRLTIPIFTGRKRYNKYLKTYKRETHTKESLTNLLIRTTNNILTSINSLYLYENGKLNDVEKIELNLLLEKRRLELKELNLIANENTKVYIKTLKKWFKQEKVFIREITPLLKNKKPVTGARPNRTDIAYSVYYLKETKELELSHPFPSGKAWEEIGGMYNKNSKNIQQAYNAICSDNEERLKMGKHQNIKYVIENMLNGHKKALELAKDEFKIAELNS